MLNLACSIGESLGKKLPGEEAYFKSAETHLDRLGLDAGHLVEAQAYAEEALDKALASVAA